MWLYTPPMPAKAKTKKKQPKKKATEKKKITPKKKAKLVKPKKKTRVKKIARVKKVAKKRTKAKVKAKAKKTAPIKKRTKAKKIKKINTSLIFYSLATTLPRREKTIIQRQNAKISPHVLDLKKIESDKKQITTEENQYSQIITEEIFNKFNKKKTDFNTNFKNLANKVENSWQSRPKIKIKFPKIARPKINLPQIKLPKLKMPKVKIGEIRLGNIIIPPYWQKTILSFVCFSLLFVLPFGLYGYYQKLEGKKNDILEKTAQALWHLTVSQKAAAATDFYYTQFELQQAAQNFNQAKNELKDINLLVKGAINLIPEYKRQFVTAQKLADIGEKLSSSAAVLTSTFDQFDQKINLENMDLTNKLIVLKDNLNLILPDLETANNDLQNIYLEEIPAEYQGKIKELQIALPLLEKNVSNFVSSSDIILSLLGNESQKRYLVLFQNNTELRPTGGFIGSFALVDIDQGNVKKINIPGGGPYDLKAGLKVSVESPEPLHIINPRWEFQDANWFADLPTSADKLIWFYEKSGGPTVDGLILINASFLQNVLKVTGPIELPEYNKTISSENFYQEIQNSVELEYNKSENKPKQIIADLTPKLISSLLHSDKKQLSDILDLVLNSLNEKEVQLYFTNFTLEKMVLQNNWGGQLKKTDKDYLDIVSTNIAGEKTDAKIEQEADLNVEIQNDGSIINTLTITKTHEGKEGEPFYGVPNLDYLRIYVPKGSQFISAQNFEPMAKNLFTLLDPEIYQKDPDIAMIEMTKKVDESSQTEIFNESDKTVFANWMKVEPGQTKSVTIKYKLPFTLDLQKENKDLNYFELLKKSFNLSGQSNDELEKYSLLWQKQSGRNDFKINLKIKFPQSFIYQFIYPQSFDFANNTFNIDDQLNTDKLFAIIFSQF